MPAAAWALRGTGEQGEREREQAQAGGEGSGHLVLLSAIRVRD